jgi:glucan 1,4-alpha-glucosidase
MSRRPFAVVALLVAALAATAAPAQAAPPTGTAADGPGDVSHFDLARKDCVGTARNRRSKVWYTIADGVLSDVYFPTNDNTNVETLQYVVTDGKTTDLQTRDMTYTVKPLDDRALGCRVTATAKSGRYRITTDYVTDPDRATIAMDSSFKALKGRASDYQLFVRFDPTLNGNGGGAGGSKTTPGEEGDNAGADSGSVASDHGHTVLVGSDPVTATIAANRDYAIPVHSALDADRGFRAVSNGFAGKASDGLTQLDASHSGLTSTFGNANGGNLVQTAQVDLGHGGDFTLALGFGDSQAKAVGAARKTLGERFGGLERDYVRGWQRYARKLVAPRRPQGVSRSRWSSLLDEYYLSAFYVKAAEDKTFRGAVAAALASPWGQALAAGKKERSYFGSYREVFARDLYEAWTALYLAGDRRTARNMTRFLFERQQLPDGSMPRNSLTNGKVAPDSFNTQLDECAYPLVMALAVGLTGPSYYENHIKPAANFVASHGPSFGPERWEEQSGFSPSTISAEIAGLLAAAKIADRNHDHASAAVWRGVADEFQRNLKAWTLTTNGPLGDGRYFIRLSRNGDPNEAVSYDLGNGGPTLDQRSVIDAGFLEYARLGLLADSDPDILRTLPIVDSQIRRSTDSGVGFFRYNGDGYGDGLSDGHPWAPTNKGSGHLWPVLAGERGQYEIDRGMTSAAISRLEAMRNMSSGVGLIAEQAWEAPDLAASPFGTNPATASIGFENGKPAGSASALTWSAGQFVRLTLDAAAGRVLDRPRYTTKRYVRHTQGHTALTVTAPTDRTIVTSPVTVTGTSTPGDTIRIAATNVDENSTTSIVSGTVGSGGSFSIPVSLIGGRSVLNIVATSPSGATAREVRTVVVLAASAPVIFSADDPDGDDHGPGNFQYPTNDAFHAGAFDIEQFQVLDTGDTVTFRVRTRDLTPTFGSPNGAQLIDVYVHDPAASSTSTAASFPPRNYRISDAGAWSRLLEVQGFGQRFVDASGATVGTISIRADDISRYITFSVPRSALGPGNPGAGWGFTVTMTAQDGFSSDQARTFAATPQPFNLGRCATDDASDPHCTTPLDQLPKVMDALPSGPDALDYTVHKPVTLSPAVVP